MKLHILVAAIVGSGIAAQSDAHEFDAIGTPHEGWAPAREYSSYRHVNNTPPQYYIDNRQRYYSNHRDQYRAHFGSAYSDTVYVDRTAHVNSRNNHDTTRNDVALVRAKAELVRAETQKAKALAGNSNQQQQKLIADANKRKASQANMVAKKTQDANKRTLQEKQKAAANKRKALQAKIAAKKKQNNKR